jgi:tetratricopeptide (TPR) repeat protein
MRSSTSYGPLRSPHLAVLLTAAFACTRPPPEAGAPAAGGAREALAGSVSCRPCHERFYLLWSTSYHGLAMQPWGPAVAGAVPPTPAPVHIGDREYLVESSDERGTVVERGAAGEQRLGIAQVLGGKNVYYFLTELDRGFLQTLPVAYDVRRKEWFDTAASGIRHAPGFSAEPLRWRDREYTFNSSCHSCHVSQLATSYDAASDAYRTTWAEPGINCEACHGPGAEHVRAFSAAPKDAPPPELKLLRTKTMTHEQRNDMCAPCHARMVPLTTSFQPGDRFFDHFDLGALEDPDFHPDGRELGETYTFTTWRLSRCAQAGGIDCVTCHTSSGRYRFRAPEDANKACLPCHARQVERGPAHTHHAAGSIGSRCVSCHMPTTEFARMRRSDHSMRPPAPAATIEFGSPNACNVCHGDRDARWADAQVRRWHAKDHQKGIVEEGRLVQAARRQDWARLPAMLAYLRRADRQEIVAASLVRLLRQCADARVPPALSEVLRADPSPLVRAAAAETLGLSAAAGRAGPLAAATRDPFRLVRVRAARALATVPRDQIEPSSREAVERATRELEAALRVRGDDPWMLTNLGTWRMDRGDLDGAAESFRDAVRIRPDHVPGWVNLSMVQAAKRDLAGAEASLRKALAVEPGNAAANLNLGLLLGEASRPVEAERALRAAVAADATLAPAHYNLCALLLPDRPREAAAHCARASELRPDSSRYAYALGFALGQAGDEKGAIAALEAHLRRTPADPAPYELLAAIHLDGGRASKAMGVYRRGVRNRAMGERDRAALERRIEEIAGR